MNTANVFKGHIGAGSFKALDGTHCWVRRRPAESASDQADSQTWCRGRSPRPSWLHRFVCHPWTLTYRARALGVQGLPHHQGHSNEWGRGTQKPHSGSFRAQPRPQRWQTTGLTREARARTLAGKGCTESPPWPCNIRQFCPLIGWCPSNARIRRPVREGVLRLKRSLVT